MPDEIEQARADEAAAGAHTAENRGLLDKAADEVASWFGDAEASSRRQRDLAAGDHVGEGPKGPVIDEDDRIAADVSRRITDDPEVGGSRIEVGVAAGAVTLAGSVSTSAERARAGELAETVAGVTQVHNRLEIA